MLVCDWMSFWFWLGLCVWGRLMLCVQGRLKLCACDLGCVCVWLCVWLAGVGWLCSTVWG